MIGRVALEQAAAAAAGLDEIPNVRMSGKTDWQILRDILAEAGVADDRIEALLPDAMAMSVELMTEAHERIEREAVVHPGVADVIDRLAELGTRAAEPRDRQPHAERATEARSPRPRRAHRLRVRRVRGRSHRSQRARPAGAAPGDRLRSESYTPDEIWVIGDTELDLACARAAGVRCLLVGTSWDGEQDASGLDADAYLADLSDTDAVLEILLG